MAKKVDITEKLSFEENPCLIIRGKQIEVNADAPTMLKVMGLMSEEDPGTQEITDAYDLMFPEASKQMLDELKLSFRDFVTVVQSAITLITGEEETPGEQ